MPRRTRRRRRGARRPPRGTSRATAGRRGRAVRGRVAGSEGSSRPSSRRSGRVSVAPSAGCGVAGSSPRSHGSSDRASRSAARPASRASSSGAVSDPVERQALDGDDRARVEAGVHPHQRHAGLAIAGHDGRRDRRRAAMPRQQRRMEVQRPERRIEERRRHDLAVVGEHDEGRLEVEDLGDGRRVTQPRRRQDGRVGGIVDGRALEVQPATGRPRRRGDDGDEVDGVVRRERAQARDGERAAAQEDRPDAIHARRPRGHASALVAPRTSASSSSSPWPTAMSSSIESR